MFLFLLSCKYYYSSETISNFNFVSFLSNALPSKLIERYTQKYLKLLFLFPVNQLLIKIRNNRNIRNIFFTLYRYAGLLKHKILRLKETHISTGKIYIPIYLGQDVIIVINLMLLIDQKKIINVSKILRKITFF